MESPLYIFEWKREPESPPQNIYEEADSWFLDDGSAASNDFTAFEASLPSEAIIKDEITITENKAEVVSKLLQDLDHLDQLDDIIKEEPFSSWLEEKVDLPIFDNIHIEPSRGFQHPRFKTEELKTISPVIHQQNIQNAPQQQNNGQNVPVVQGQNNIPSQDTSSLLQEFENVFDHVEMTHGQLTPPQSPPLTPVVSQSPPLSTTGQVLTPLAPMHASTFQLIQNSPIYFQQAGTQIILQANNIPQQQMQSIVHPQVAQIMNNSNNQVGNRLGMELAPATPQPDVAHELAVVDELVRSRAENMVETWNNYPSNSPKSYAMMQSPSSPSSSSSSGFSEYSSDLEWIPEPVHDKLSDKPTRGRKRAGKPYSRIGPEDKKSRKKEQNKNAATRYRLKKKAEIEEILTEEKSLTDCKVDLQAKVTDLQREIKCLKGLMRDLFKAKGLIQ